MFRVCVQPRLAMFNFAAFILAAFLPLLGIQTSKASQSEASKTSEPETSKASESKSLTTERTPSSDSLSKIAKVPKSQNPRVLLITAKGNDRCDKELARLRQPGRDFEIMRARGWKIGPGPDNHLQIIDQEEVADLIEQLTAREFPLVVCIDGPQIVRSFKSGCTTPLDVWTFGFMAKGIDERPAGFIPEAARVETTGNYPLRGNHWSIDDLWNPSRDQVISHLRGPTHAHMIRAHWKIETWSYEELRSMHDNLHEQEMGGVQPMSRYQQQKKSNNEFSAGRKIKGF